MKQKTFPNMNPQTMTSLSMVGAMAITAAAAALTGQDGVWGALIGFLAGLTQHQWLFRDLNKAFDAEMPLIMGRYMRSLMVRWGLVAVMILLMVRYFEQGLLFLVIGLALGIITAILIEVLKMTKGITHKEKGGEK